jgi:hypothetical protein
MAKNNVTVKPKSEAPSILLGALTLSMSIDYAVWVITRQDLYITIYQFCNSHIPAINFLVIALFRRTPATFKMWNSNTLNGLEPRWIKTVRVFTNQQAMLERLLKLDCCDCNQLSTYITPIISEKDEPNPVSR